MPLASCLAAGRCAGSFRVVVHTVRGSAGGLAAGPEAERRATSTGAGAGATGSLRRCLDAAQRLWTDEVVSLEGRLSEELHGRRPAVATGWQLLS